MFKRNILVIFLVGIFSFPGFLIAQEIDEEKQGLIKEVLEITKTLELFDTIKQASVAQFEQNIIASGVDLTPEQITAGKEVVAEVFEEMRNDLFILTIKIYDENYSTQEMVKILSFYKSDVGQLFINKMPQVASQVLQETTVLIQKIQPLIQSRMVEKFQALEKKDADS